ncbi:hypothetical protein Tco_0178650 [Tanacetum coccineum]
MNNACSSGGGLIIYQAYGNLYAMTAFGRHLEEIHVTWAQLKETTRRRTTPTISKNSTQNGDSVTDDIRHHNSTKRVSRTQDGYSEEEVAKTMAETMEQYMSKTRANYGSGVARPKIEEEDNFELKGQFLEELRTNTFSGSDHEDANEYIEKVLEIVDLFHIPNITIDQVMLRAFLMSLTGAASRWLRNKPTGSIQLGKI